MNQHARFVDPHARRPLTRVERRVFVALLLQQRQQRLRVHDLPLQQTHVRIVDAAATAAATAIAVRSIHCVGTRRFRPGFRIVGTGNRRAAAAEVTMIGRRHCCD